jgi:hypothetical protein
MDDVTWERLDPGWRVVPIEFPPITLENKRIIAQDTLRKVSISKGYHHLWLCRRS